MCCLLVLSSISSPSFSVFSNRSSFHVICQIIGPLTDNLAIVHSSVEEDTCVAEELSQPLQRLTKLRS